MNGPLKAIRREITVAAPVETAFAMFTAHIGRWWPLGTHSVHGSEGVVAFEGDRLVERWGAEHSIWAEVVSWNPPMSFRLTWHPGSSPDDATDSGGHLHRTRRRDPRHPDPLRVGAHPGSGAGDGELRPGLAVRARRDRRLARRPRRPGSCGGLPCQACRRRRRRRVGHPGPHSGAGHASGTVSSSTTRASPTTSSSWSGSEIAGCWSRPGRSSRSAAKA